MNHITHKTGFWKENHEWPKGNWTSKERIYDTVYVIFAELQRGWKYMLQTCPAESSQACSEDITEKTCAQQETETHNERRIHEYAKLQDEQAIDDTTRKCLSRKLNLINGKCCATEKIYVTDTQKPNGFVLDRTNWKQRTQMILWGCAIHDK